MTQTQKKYAKAFLMEIYNQSSDLYTGNTTVDGACISMQYSFDYASAEESLIELGSSLGFTASCNYGVEWRQDFSREGNGIDEMEHIDGYFSLYVLFYENETKIVCEIIKDIENCLCNGGVSYKPVSELIYEKSINWEELNDYGFQMQEYKYLKQAIQDKQF